MLTSNTAFKARRITSAKERYFNLTIESICQEDHSILNLYAYNNISLYYAKQKLIEIKK